MMKSIIAILVVVIVAGAGYWAYDKNNQDADQEAADDSSNVSPLPVPAPAPVPNPTPAASQQSFLEIKELGIKIPSQPQDLTYKISEEISTWMILSTTGIVSADAQCTDALGSITVNSLATNPGAQMVKSLGGGKYVHYATPQEVCTTDAAVVKKIQDARKLLDANLSKIVKI